MNGLTLKHLRYFVALSETRHFAKAAQDCAISQPALSLQIKQLEVLVGSPLLERQGRNVQLTSRGDLFATKARAILQSVDDLGNHMRAGQDSLSGPLRLGIIPTIAPYLLPDIFRTISEHFPALELVMQESITPRLVEDVREGKLDGAILALPVRDASLTSHALFRETFRLVRPRADAHLPVPDVSSLREMQLLLLEEGHCFRDQALAYCEIDQTQGRNIMSGSTLTTLVQMVASGLGITLVPEMAMAVESRIADVDFLPLLDPQPYRDIGMIWRKSNPLGVQLRQVAEVVGNAVS